MLQLWLGVTRVTVDGGRITVARGLVLPGKQRSFPVAEIADVALKIGMQAGGKAYSDIKLLRTNGKQVTAGSGIGDKREAERVVRVVKQACGVSS